MPPETQQPQPTHSLQSLLGSYQVSKASTTKARNRREELLELFRERLNKDREGTVFKPLKFFAVKQAVSHLTNFDLEVFYKQCLEAKTFTGCFWGSLKVRK